MFNWKGNAHKEKNNWDFLIETLKDYISWVTHSSSVQFSHLVVSNSLQLHEPQHARPPCPSPTPRVYPNSCPSSRWCHPTISSSVIPFSSCLQSFPASGSFPMSQFFASGGQSTGVSASASVLPMNIQDWFPLEWTGWISLLLDLLADIFQRTLLKEKSLKYRRFQWKTTAQRQECPSLCVETSTLNTSSLSQGYFIRG